MTTIRDAPTLIVGSGFDGSQEDMYHNSVVPALARGWNAITYEGPGQPKVRRDQNLGFIPNWEAVVTPLVDYLLAEKGAIVDRDRIVLVGYSLGGYLAARAAAFEPRISAVVLDGGVYNAYDSFASGLTPDALEALNSGNKSAFDAIVTVLQAQPDLPTTVRWGLEQGLWSFNTRSGFDFLQQIKAFTLEDVANSIQVPVFIADAEFEGFFVGQSSLVKDALGDRATLHVFKGAAGYHCQAGAMQELNRVMFGWLHKTLW